MRIHNSAIRWIRQQINLRTTLILCCVNYNRTPFTIFLLGSHKDLKSFRKCPSPSERTSSSLQYAVNISSIFLFLKLFWLSGSSGSLSEKSIFYWRYRYLQCCRSMTFWSGSGSGSADPCLWLLDPDPGSGFCYFRHWPSRCQQKTIVYFIFSTCYFLKVYLHNFQR